MLTNIKMENGHLSSGIGTPEGPQSGGGHPMYGGGHPGGGGGGPGDYNPAHSHSYLGPSPPSFMNGLGGHSNTHHSGGYCSQMSLNQNNPQPPNSRPLHCGGCRGPILERYYLDALDSYWHNSCLKCNMCSATLVELGQTCFTKEGMILCRADYYRMFRHRQACQGCGQGIPASELVMRAGSSGVPGSSPPFVYHLKCFSCSKCGGVLQKGDKYSVLNGVLYCEQDVLKLMKNGIGSPSSANVAMTNGPAPRKGKVGRPRRSKD